MPRSWSRSRNSSSPFMRRFMETELGRCVAHFAVARPPSAGVSSTARSWGCCFTRRCVGARWLRSTGPTSTSAMARCNPRRSATPGLKGTQDLARRPRWPRRRTHRPRGVAARDPARGRLEEPLDGRPLRRRHPRRPSQFFLLRLRIAAPAVRSSPAPTPRVISSPSGHLLRLRRRLR